MSQRKSASEFFGKSQFSTNFSFWWKKKSISFQIPFIMFSYLTIALILSGLVSWGIIRYNINSQLKEQNANNIRQFSNEAETLIETHDIQLMAPYGVMPGDAYFDHLQNEAEMRATGLFKDLSRALLTEIFASFLIIMISGAIVSLFIIKKLVKFEEDNTRMRGFVSDVSHELKTPIAIMKGYLELYNMGAVKKSDEDKLIHNIQKANDRMNGLVQNMLKLTTLENTKDDPQEIKNYADLKLIKKTILTAKDDIKLLDNTRDIILELPEIKISYKTKIEVNNLELLMTNLTGNVLKHTKNGVPVKISATMINNDKVLELKFSDYGEGVTDEMKEKMFERFVTADDSRSKEKSGTGLGLSIAQAVVNNSSGTIKAIDTLTTEQVAKLKNDNKISIFNANNVDDVFSTIDPDKIGKGLTFLIRIPVI
ncbi:MAG: HAMP domain-containing histidine kinase [Bifidobacteriaceae bacterium]|jgi:signal transduction histidine kinase|nr:HAMP domain-containing histidine kinase [Bifidobacteriaceae bacterium]